MLEAAILAVRFLQYAGAAILFGAPLFFLYALPAGAPAPRGSRAMVGGAAALLVAASALAVAAQASLFAGSFAEGLTGEAMAAVVSYMAFGKAAVVRALAALLALGLLLALPRGRSGWLPVAAAGAVAAGSLGWMGHAAASEGPLAGAHLTADVLHILAACAWLGALAGFVLLARDGARRADLHSALRTFSAIGPALIAVLVLSGLVNTWVLVGPGHVADLVSTAYGWVLLAKLALFAGMLALAAANRYRHTAAVAEGAPLRSARRSVAWEAGIGLAVLALVAWLGTLAPPGFGA
jgi:putative copper resistance protein D